MPSYTTAAPPAPTSRGRLPASCCRAWSARSASTVSSTAAIVCCARSRAVPTRWRCCTPYGSCATGWGCSWRSRRSTTGCGPRRATEAELVAARARDLGVEWRLLAVDVARRARRAFFVVDFLARRRARPAARGSRRARARHRREQDRARAPGRRSGRDDPVPDPARHRRARAGGDPLSTRDVRAPVARRGARADPHVSTPPEHPVRRRSVESGRALRAGAAAAPGVAGASRREPAPGRGVARARRRCRAPDHGDGRARGDARRPPLNRRAAAVVERLRRARGGTRRVDVAGAEVEISYGQVTGCRRAPPRPSPRAEVVDHRRAGRLRMAGGAWVAIREGAPVEGAASFDAELLSGPLRLRRPGPEIGCGRAAVAAAASFPIC